jgi:hypothetical protein
MRVAVFALLLCGALGDSPVDRVVTLLKQLKSKIEADGDSEQTAYTEFETWCTKTKSATTSSITSDTATVESLSETILTKKGVLGTLSAELAHIKKSLAENAKSQKDALAMRENQHSEYVQKKNEMEEAIGALESAIQALQGAGTGAGLLTVAADVRGALALAPKGAVSREQLSTVKQFLTNPGSFAQSRSTLRDRGVDPHAPASGEISGILRDMYLTFVSDLQQASEEEADQRKLHEDLMSSKQTEQGNLESSLDDKESDNADASEVEASSREERDETQRWLKSNSEFLAETEQKCKDKKYEWDQRKEARAQEVAGIEKAIDILDDSDAQSRFASATSSFVQIGQRPTQHEHAVRAQVFKMLSDVSRKSQRLDIAFLSADTGSGMNFDKVVAGIDKLVERIRKEEKEDVDALDVCREDKAKHEGQKEDLTNRNDMLGDKKSTLEGRKTLYENTISDLETKITSVNTTLNSMISARNDEHHDFVQGLEDDEQAVTLLDKAIAALKDYYRTHPAMLAQSTALKLRKDDPPRADFKDDGAHKTESDQIISMMEMIKEDLQTEIKVAHVDEKKAVEAHQKNYHRLLKTIRDMQKSIADFEKEIAEIDDKVAAIEEDTEANDDEKTAVETAEALVEPNCSSLEKNLESRRAARTTEMQGLVDARAAMLGAVDDASSEFLFLQRKPLLSK